MSWSLVQTVWIAIFTVKVTLRFKILQKWVFDGSFKPFATKVGLLFSRSQWGFESSVNLSCIFWNAVSLCYQTWYLIIWQRSFLSAFTTGSHTSRWLWELFVHGWFLHRCFRNMALKKKWDRVVSPVPNPQAGGPAVLILSVPSPAQTSPARLDLPGALEGSSQHSSGDQWGTLAILPQQGTSTRDGKIGMLVYHYWMTWKVRLAKTKSRSWVQVFKTVYVRHISSEPLEIKLGMLVQWIRCRKIHQYFNVINSVSLNETASSTCPIVLLK